MKRHVRRLLAELLVGLERLLGAPMVGAADAGWPGTAPMPPVTRPWRRER